MGELGLVMGATTYSGATREEVARSFLGQHRLPINAENIRRFVAYAWPSHDQGVAGPRPEPPHELFGAASPASGPTPPTPATSARSSGAPALDVTVLPAGSAEMASVYKRAQARLTAAIVRGLSQDLAVIGLDELRLATPTQKARLIERCLDGWTGSRREELILAVLYSAQGPALDELLQLLGEARFAKLFSDLHANNYQTLLLHLARNLTSPRWQARFLSRCGDAAIRRDCLTAVLLGGGLAALERELQTTGALRRATTMRAELDRVRADPVAARLLAEQSQAAARAEAPRWFDATS